MRWGFIRRMGLFLVLPPEEKAFFPSPLTRQGGDSEVSDTLGLFLSILTPKGQDDQGFVPRRWLLILPPSTRRQARSRNEDTQARGL